VWWGPGVENEVAPLARRGIPHQGVDGGTPAGQAKSRKSSLPASTAPNARLLMASLYCTSLPHKLRMRKCAQPLMHSMHAWHAGHAVPRQARLVSASWRKRAATSAQPSSFANAAMLFSICRSSSKDRMPLRVFGT
jgi:hypothetical protein